MENLDQTLSRISALEGVGCPVECLNLLYQYSKSTAGKGEIVEIGTFSGKSTIALALGQKAKIGKKIFAVDHLEHAQLHHNLKEFGVTDYVQQIIGNSAKVGEKWTDPIELLWIDGGHSYACLLQDIKYWTSHVLIGGHVIFHDYPGVLKKIYRDHMPDDVHRALHHTLLKFPRYWKIVDDRRSDGHTIVFEKLKWSDDQYEQESFINLIKYKIREIGYKR